MSVHVANLSKITTCVSRSKVWRNGISSSVGWCVVVMKQHTLTQFSPLLFFDSCMNCFHATNSNTQTILCVCHCVTAIVTFTHFLVFFFFFNSTAHKSVDFLVKQISPDIAVFFAAAVRCLMLYMLCFDTCAMWNLLGVVNEYSSSDEISHFDFSDTAILQT